MRVITLNVDGIRSAADKGFIRWMQRQQADVVAVQDVRAQEHELARPIAQPRGFHSYFADALDPAGGGVAIYCRQEPDRVLRGMGWREFDEGGRLIAVDFGNLTVMSLCMPSGGGSDQAFKMAVLDRLLPFLHERANDGRDYIICGDWKIALRAIDVQDALAAEASSGFLPEEPWLDKVLGDVGWVDALRAVTEDPVPTAGWRRDHQLISPTLRGKVVESSIYTKRQFASHSPLTIDYAYALEGRREIDSF